MKSIAAALLSERVTLQEKSVTRDSFGAESVSWVNVTTVWAQAQPLSGREYVSMRAAQSDISTRFRLRYLPGITTAHRVLWRGVPHDIREVINTDADRAVLELLTTAEAVAT